MSASVPCPECSGWGTTEVSTTCTRCEGRGSVLVVGVCCSGYLREAIHDGTCPLRLSRSAGS